MRTGRETAPHFFLAVILIRLDGRRRSLRSSTRFGSKPTPFDRRQLPHSRQRRVAQEQCAAASVGEQLTRPGASDGDASDLRDTPQRFCHCMKQAASAEAVTTIAGAMLFTPQRGHRQAFAHPGR